MENLIAMPNDLQRDNASFGINDGTLLNVSYLKDTKAHEWSRFLLLAVESLIIFGVFKFFLDQSFFQTEHYRITGPLVTLIFCLAWWVIAFLPSHSYLRSDSSFREGISFSNLWGPLLLHSGIVAFILVMLNFPISYYPYLIQSYVSIIVLLIIVRLIYQVSQNRGLLPTRSKFLIAGTGFHGQRVAASLAEKWGYDLFGGTFEYPSLQDENFTESFNAFKKYCIETHIRHIFIALPAYDRDQVDTIAEFAASNFIRCSILPAAGLPLQDKKRMYFIENIPVYDQSIHPLQKSPNRIVKRIFDILFASSVILTIFPWLLPIIAILIKLSSGGLSFFSNSGQA